MTQGFRHLLRMQNGNGKRSTVLQPIQWVIAIVAAPLAPTIAAGSSNWVSAILLAFLAGILGFFGYAYHHFMKNDPDSLRSEPFTITKMAIEKGIMGDNLIGISTTADITTKRPSEGGNGKEE